VVVESGVSGFGVATVGFGLVGHGQGFEAGQGRP
jgi:hypothetical protein